ncbi:MAG: hypothetical protein WCX17_00950 [Parcubacteria group bacterium]|jgi:hypothetical protein
MSQSKIEDILEEVVRGNEKVEKLSGRFHAVESEIDNMAGKPEADLDKILRRAKELIYRVFDGYHSSFLDSKWSGIEDKIEKNLKDLKNNL